MEYPISHDLELCSDPEHREQNGKTFCSGCFAKQFVKDLFTLSEMSKPFIEQLKRLGR